MQDGKQIDSSQQRIIDAYVSKYGEKLSSFNEYEQGVINNILKMNNDMYYYNTYNKYSDKLKAMERFNQDLAEFKEIDQSIK
nr:hypothetical protein [Mycobacterium sp. E3298]